jgi:SulP family sulfate permease
MSGSAKKRRRGVVADLLAGSSVGLLLIPQSMAYAELAGLPPHHGLYAAALPPILAAIFASSPYLQTGPVALTSLLTFGALATLATPFSSDYILLAGLLALVVGVVRLGVGLMRAGAVAYLMSQPVLRGFTAAAAVLIFASQLPSALGVAGGHSVLEGALDAVVHPGGWEPFALASSLATLALMFGGRKIHPLFPGVLMAVVVGVVISASTGYGGAVVGSVPELLLPPVTLVDLPYRSLPALAVAGGIIAMVGFAEAASVSQTFAEQTRTTWSPNKEFVSQGVANLTAGLFGGFPVGGSFSRSALNKHAGAVTRLSGAITGLTVLAFLPFAAVIAPLPKAILGAIVIGAVLKLLDPRPLLEIYRASKPQAMVALSTFAMTLLLAPHVEYAVLAGIFIALGVHAWREMLVEVVAERDEGTLILRPRGVIWFASAPMFRQRMGTLLAQHDGVDSVVIHLGGLGRIDLTGASMLRSVARGITESGIDARVCCASRPSAALLRRVMPDYLVDANAPSA